MWATGFLTPAVLGLGFVCLPALFHLVGRQRLAYDRFAPVSAALVASVGFAVWNWASFGGAAADDLNVASLFIGFPAAWCWATGFGLRWRWVRALGRPWLLATACSGFALYGWFIDLSVGLPCLAVLLVWLPLAVHGAVASAGRLAWLAWPLVGAGTAVAATIVKDTWFADPFPATVGVLAALTLFAPLLSLGRVANRLCAVPLDHAVVTDYGAALPYARGENS